MAKLDLTKYGIIGATEVVHNPSYEVLFEAEMDPTLEGFEKGQLTELGAVNVMTGIYTGRSPKDKFIVMDENSNCKVNKLKKNSIQQSINIRDDIRNNTLLDDKDYAKI